MADWFRFCMSKSNNALAYVAPTLCNRNQSPVYCHHSNDLDQNNHWYIPHCRQSLLCLLDTGLTGVDCWQYHNFDRFPKLSCPFLVLNVDSIHDTFVF